MKIQSLSVCVPTSSCVNDCEFCVAHMHCDKYTNQIEKNKRFMRLYKEDFKKRLQFARDNGCNTMMITGDGEAPTNRIFLEKLADWNQSIESPFRWIELQTTGVLVDDECLRFFRDDLQVNTISVSLSSIFSSEDNAKYNRPKAEKFFVDIENLCTEIKRYDFNLRLSVNLTDFYNDKTIEEIFARAKELGADQITFRVLYTSGTDTPQDKWIAEHKANDNKIKEIQAYVKKNGKPLERLPFGAIKYALNDMSIVIDDDCMATELAKAIKDSENTTEISEKTVAPPVSDTLKYLILRPDCKLYSDWSEKASLIF